MSVSLPVCQTLQFICSTEFHRIGCSLLGKTICIRHFPLAVLFTICHKTQRMLSLLWKWNPALAIRAARWHMQNLSYYLLDIMTGMTTKFRQNWGYCKNPRNMVSNQVDLFLTRISSSVCTLDKYTYIYIFLHLCRISKIRVNNQTPSHPKDLIVIQ